MLFLGGLGGYPQTRVWGPSFGSFTLKQVWGPRLADSRDRGLLGLSERAISCKKGRFTLPTLRGAPGWQIPGTRGLRSEGATPPTCPASNAKSCPAFEQPLQGARGEVFVGSPCFSSSGRHSREDPQPDSPFQLRLL